MVSKNRTIEIKNLIWTTAKFSLCRPHCTRFIDKRNWTPKHFFQRQKTIAAHFCLYFCMFTHPQQIKRKLRHWLLPSLPLLSIKNMPFMRKPVGKESSKRKGDVAFQSYWHWHNRNKVNIPTELAHLGTLRPASTCPRLSSLSHWSNCESSLITKVPVTFRKDHYQKLGFFENETKLRIWCTAQDIKNN